MNGLRHGDPVQTPHGPGRFWGYDGDRAIVEMEHRYLVVYERWEVTQSGDQVRGDGRGVPGTRDA